MSAADTAVKSFRKLEPEDLRILHVIEANLSRYRYIPEKTIQKLAKLTEQQTQYRLHRLSRFKLIYRSTGGPYTGYTLNMAGYDSLAINALVKAEILEAFGKPLGVGKEADVYDALTPDNKQIAVKFHRLGRTSFRQTRRVRGYAAERRHISWLYQSRLAAEKEFQALKLLYPHRIAVPKPIYQNRHVVAMSMIEGAELAEHKELPNPQKTLQEVLSNIRRAYEHAGIIHADLSEYNVIIKPNWHTLIIDWPQHVTREHPNAEQLLKRDIRNILRFFQRKYKLKTKLKDALNYVQTS
ncbi:MAG: serine/threonine-protein kinase RIO2 [Candidatus Bathyarchaeia archaeon]